MLGAIFGPNGTFIVRRARREAQAAAA